MKPFQEFYIALNSYGKGVRLLFHPKIRRFLLIPIVFNIFLLWGGYSLLGSIVDNISDSFFQLINIESWNFWGSEYFDDFFIGLLHLLFKVLFFIIMVFYGGFLVIVLMSPFFSMISERIEEVTTQKSYPFSYEKLFKDIWRGIRITVRNSLLQLVFSIGVFLLGFVPVIGILSPVLLFIVTAFFYGFSFMDFAMERRYPTIKESVGFMRKHRIAAFVNGSVFALSILLPLCNLFLAAFVAIWAVVAGTLTILKIEERNKNPNID